MGVQLKAQIHRACTSPCPLSQLFSVSSDVLNLSPRLSPFLPHPAQIFSASPAAIPQTRGRIPPRRSRTPDRKGPHMDHRFSIGVEEEFQIVDPTSGELRSHVSEL